MLKTTTQFINATIFAGFSRTFFQSFRFFGINSEWLILAEILINLAVLLWVIMEQAENKKYSLLVPL